MIWFFLTNLYSVEWTKLEDLLRRRDIAAGLSFSLSASDKILIDVLNDSVEAYEYLMISLYVDLVIRIDLRLEEMSFMSINLVSIRRSLFSIIPLALRYLLQILLMLRISLFRYRRLNLLGSITVSLALAWMFEAY